MLKGLLVFVMTILITCIGVNSVFAARSTGADSTGRITYDYKLSCSIWPWTSIGGYTNTTFVLTEAQYNAGFTGKSNINIEYDYDYSKYVYKTVSVTEGTNYARTGTVTLKGYRSNCTSSHTSILKLNGKTYSYNEHLKE